MANHSDRILDTVETFLETHPDLRGELVVFGPRTDGEADGVRMMTVSIRGENHLVVAKRGG